MLSCRCSVCACMQTQHKTQLDKRDRERGQGGPGAPGPMQAPMQQAIPQPGAPQGSYGPAPTAGYPPQPQGYGGPGGYPPQGYPPQQQGMYK